MKIELITGQMWKVGSGFIRVVKVGKLLVEYKVMQDLDHKVAPLSLISQKDFCALLKAKKATLLPPVVAGTKPANKKVDPAPKTAAASKPAVAKKTKLNGTATVKAKTPAASAARKPAKKAKAK